MASKIDFDFLTGPAAEVAPRLLGCILERQLDNTLLRVKIVETEAYDQTDIASHSYNGKTPRTEVMFGPAGRLYVYFTYGMHYCCNIVVGKKDHGAAVLVRAVEPVSGQKTMQRRRQKQGYDITNGPAKLCQALAIDTSMNGHDLKQPPLLFVPQPAINRRDIVQTTRIGISKGKDVPWRFFVKDNPYVSRQAP